MRASSLLLALVLPCAAAQPFTLDQILSAPFASGLVRSEDGRHIAWVENVRGVRNVWAADAPEWHARELTQFKEDDGQDIGELVWDSAGQHVAFTRAGDIGEVSGEDPNPLSLVQPPHREIWIAPDAHVVARGTNAVFSPDSQRVWFLRDSKIFSCAVAGGEDREEVVVQGSPRELSWSPDGSELAFTNARKGHSFIALFHPGARNLQFLDPSVDNDWHATWSSDGRKIAFIREPAATTQPIFGAQRSGPPWSIHVCDTSGQCRKIFRATEGPGSVFHSLETERQLLWTAAGDIVFPWEKTGWLRLWSVPSTGGTPRALTPDDAEVQDDALTLDKRDVLFTSNKSDSERRHLWTATPQATQITTGTHIEWHALPVSDGVAYLTTDASHAAHVALRRADGTRISVSNNPEPPPGLIAPEPVSFRSADGLQIHGQIFRPTGNGKHAAVVFFHGGSRRQMLLGFHYMYYYSNAYAMNEYLASLGYLVLSVNYRSGIGYGLNFREAEHYGATGASEFQDVTAAARYLAERSDVDARHIGCWGGSYGGYLTALALARASELYAAGVDFHGVHDWNIEFEGEQIPGTTSEREAFSSLSLASSPLFSVKNWRSPVLLIQGDDDRTVSFQQTIRLVEALRREHVEIEQLILPGEVHDFLLWDDWKRSYSATADFLNRKLMQQ